METIKRGIYRHYKGKLYRVLGIARHSETVEEMVLYQTLYENEFGKGSFWIRPVSMFLEHVELNGIKVPRFTFVSEDEGTI